MSASQEHQPAVSLRCASQHGDRSRRGCVASAHGRRAGSSPARAAHAPPPQVGTLDGRVKLIGKPGVEVTLRSTSRSPTKYLGFLPNKGAVLRVTQVRAAPRAAARNAAAAQPRHTAAAGPEGNRRSRSDCVVRELSDARILCDTWVPSPTPQNLNGGALRLLRRTATSSSSRWWPRSC